MHEEDEAQLDVSEATIDRIADRVAERLEGRLRAKQEESAMEGATVPAHRLGMNEESRPVDDPEDHKVRLLVRGPRETATESEAGIETVGVRHRAVPDEKGYYFAKK